ncbi:hypothetical protein GN956_G6983 [Arapaima gigas]
MVLLAVGSRLFLSGSVERVRIFFSTPFHPESRSIRRSRTESQKVALFRSSKELCSHFSLVQTSFGITVLDLARIFRSFPDLPRN